MPEDIIKRVLHSLSCGKYKVLKRIAEESGAAGGNVIKNSDSFLFNEQFTCPMRKIRIPMASVEESHNVKRVEEDRSIVNEVVIVISLEDAVAVAVDLRDGFLRLSITVSRR